MIKSERIQLESKLPNIGNFNDFEQDSFSYLLSRLINNINQRSYSLETY